MQMLGATMQANPNPHLPEHLQEICAILAKGILRLRSRTATENTNTAAQGRDRGDIRLHSAAPQRRHANRTNRRLA
jgi:hypothetical protein